VIKGILIGPISRGRFSIYYWKTAKKVKLEIDEYKFNDVDLTVQDSTIESKDHEINLDTSSYTKHEYYVEDSSNLLRLKLQSTDVTFFFKLEGIDEN